MKIQMQHIYYHYKRGKDILQDITQEFESGKVYAIVGKSGAGKTTLLSLLGGMYNPTKGEILLDDKSLDEIGLCKYRNLNVGYVYQNYNLLEYYSSYQNIKEAADICYKKINDLDKQITGLLEKLQIRRELWNQLVGKLSGGEKQRVAIARALIKKPDILLADEPTGNLDDDTAREIQKILFDSAHKDGKCVIVVTHSKMIGENADVLLELIDGKLQCLQ